MLRVTRVGVGVMLGVAAIATAPVLACSCPGPSRPMMQTCEAASAGATVTTLDIVSWERVSGAQGGTHVELVAELTGSGLGSCIAQRSEFAFASGTATSATNVPLRGTATRATTGTILLFPDSYWPYDEAAEVTVQIGGLEARRIIGNFDAGPSTDGALPDANRDR